MTVIHDSHPWKSSTKVINESHPGQSMIVPWQPDLNCKPFLACLLIISVVLNGQTFGTLLFDHPVVEIVTGCETFHIFSRSITVDESKFATIECCKLLSNGWPLEQIIWTRAAHMLSFLSPYVKHVAFLSTPVFIQYGAYNTGKTTLLSAFRFELFVPTLIQYVLKIL